MKNNIKQVIDSMGITQKQLANLVGMTEPGISKAINGSASEETIRKVANALHVTEASLIDNSELYEKYSSGDNPLILGNLQLDCYVLNNGLRVFSGRGIQKALGNPSQSGDWLKRFCSSESLYPVFSMGENSILERAMSPVTFRRKNAGGSQILTNAYEATFLIDLCSAILDARDSNLIADPVIISSAETIIRAVAKVGVIALVDEATGYDKVKNQAKDALRKFLDTFIKAEASRWVKTFPDSFFEDIYKLRGWNWTNIAQRPGIVGKMINDIVYERLGPSVRAQLEEMNPSDGHGKRAKKHHQYLSQDVGIPALKDHLISVHTLAKASRYNWNVFMQMLDEVHPRQYQQLYLFGPDV